MVPVAHSPSYPFKRANYKPQMTCEVVPVSPAVVYHWTVPDDAVPFITQAVEHLTAIGHGESLVIGRVLGDDGIPVPNWIPDVVGDHALRVPGLGRFETLERDFQRGRTTTELDLSYPYRVQGEKRLATAFQPVWNEWLILQLDAPADIRCAALLAEALRLAVLSILGNHAHPQIHGHGTTSPHVAWTVLPDVGHDYARGKIMGLGAWLPVELEAADDQQLRLAFSRLREIHYKGLRLPVSIPRLNRLALRRSSWARPARIWATATPMVLDHRISHDDEAARIVAKTLRRAGYPLPQQVHVHSVPMLTGAAHAGETQRRRNPNPRRHAIVEFAEPINGPLLAGAERHFGLGLFKPIG
jgi:CRISPR-associated protein Csb2